MNHSEIRLTRHTTGQLFGKSQNSVSTGEPKSGLDVGGRGADPLDEGGSEF